jgi:hypothetical protein
LDLDPRVWKNSYYISHLICDYLIIGISLRFLFRSIKLKNRRFENYSNHKENGVLSLVPKLDKINPYSYIFFFINSTVLFYLYFFSRHYIYEVAYENFYSYRLITNKDFLDMCDSLKIKNRLKNEKY